jgi:hypothetical protein
MKKFIYSLLAILLAAALVSCNLNSVPGGGDDESRDRGGTARELPRFITMRLADYKDYENDTIGIGIGNTVSLDSRSESRALSLPNAQAFHDFFEVVFFFNGGAGSEVVARASWKIGHVPEISGVYRTAGAGVDYSNVGVPDTGNGSAMLFVGEESDKTLLAVGRLIEAEGSQGVKTGTYVNTDTRIVTFEVTALKAGASDDKNNSSFFTNYALGPSLPSATEAGVIPGNTEIDDRIYIHYVGKKPFPLYKINPKSGSSNVTWGRYNFAVDEEVSGFNFNKYATGILLAGLYNLEKRYPRYLITNGLYQQSSFLQQDCKTGVFLESPNNLLGGAPNSTVFNNPVRFRFDTSAFDDGVAEEGWVFALAFEIYVHNLSALPAASNGPAAERWRISTGSGTKWLDLDDGFGGEGGAIFIGVGNVFQWLPTNL